MEEDIQLERLRLKKNMEVLKAREQGKKEEDLELSDKLKETERQRQANEAVKKTLGDKEAGLRERER